MEDFSLRSECMSFDMIFDSLFFARAKLGGFIAPEPPRATRAGPESPSQIVRLVPATVFHPFPRSDVLNPGDPSSETGRLLDGDV